MPTYPGWLDQGTTGSTLVWNHWISAGTTQISAPLYQQAVANNAIWNAWITDALTQPIITGTGTTGTVWINWNGAVFPQSPAPPVPASPEALAARERQRRISATREHARRLRRKLAERRAEALLLDHLDETQRTEWEADHAFHVETADGRRRYRIARGLAGNVRLVKIEGEAPVSKHGRPLYEGARFCAHVYHPGGWVPDEDNVLTQKLMLEACEDEFLAMANVS